MSAFASLIVAFMMYGSMRAGAFITRNRRHSILYIGTDGVGKTTFLYQMENRMPISPDLPKTNHLSVFNKTVSVKVDDDKVKMRTVKTRDVPGEGYMNGMWWNLVKENKPHAIVYIIDDRFIHPEEGERQHTGLKMTIEMLTSDIYKKIIPEKHRCKAFLLVANKADIWRDQNNLSLQTLITPVEKDLKRLSAENIKWGYCACSSKTYQHVEYVNDWVIKILEDDE